MPKSPPSLVRRERKTLRRRGYVTKGTEYRKQVQVWYSSRRWKRRREQQLADEPLCRMCRHEQRPTPASVADHIEPHRGDYDLFWHGELQSLCKRHHDSDKALSEAKWKRS